MSADLFLTIEEIARRLRARAMTATELTAATLERLEGGLPDGGIASILKTRALREAARADRLLSRGASEVLTGVPYGAKDLLAARGAPTTWGAPSYRARTLAFDATPIARLHRRGAVLTAKLAMIELAGAGGYRYASASLHGLARNPWDPRRFTGGSSSGSAQLVANGVLPFALASETAGSIATPAAFCGVTGVRPTPGLVSRYGAMVAAWSLDKIGVMARSAADCTIVLDAIAGSDPKDPSTCRCRYRPADSVGFTDDTYRARIGWDPALIERTASPDVATAVMRAIDDLRGAGFAVTRASLDFDLPLRAMSETVFRAEACSSFYELIHGPELAELVDERQRLALRSGDRIRAVDYLQAMRLRTVLQRQLASKFAEHDLFVSYTRPDTAPLIDEPLDGASVNTDLILAGNLAGLPAVFAPCGFSREGLPISIQIIGPPFSDGLLIAVARRYQQHTGHHVVRPPASPAAPGAAGVVVS